MKSIWINPFGDVAVPDEFRPGIESAVGMEICRTTAKPSEIVEKLRNGRAVILMGDYRQAESMMHYIHHFEDRLLVSDHETSGQEEKQKSKSFRAMRKAAEKRDKIYRLFYMVRQNSFPFFQPPPVQQDFQRWLAEDPGDALYLLPARRYERILTDIKREEEGMDFSFLKSRLYVLPFVYVPFDQTVPAMFLRYGDCVKGRTVAEIGTGTGILSVMAAQMGAKSVVASDINANAVACAQKNVKAAGAEHIVTEIVISDLFANIKGRFDVILFNAPWVRGTPKNTYETAIYDDGYATINRLLRQAPEHMTDDGLILLQYSDISQINGDRSMDNLHDTLRQNGLRIMESESSGILRRNKLFGVTERVSVFMIRKG